LLPSFGKLGDQAGIGCACCSRLKIRLLVPICGATGAERLFCFRKYVKDLAASTGSSRKVTAFFPRRAPRHLEKLSLIAAELSLKQTGGPYLMRSLLMKHLISFVGCLLLFAGKAYCQAPQITSLSVSSGITGTSVTINGQNFGSSQGSSTVMFNGVPGTPTNWSSTGTSIAVPVPSAATTGNVVVTVGGVNSNGVLFTVIPHIAAISPVSGPITTVVQLTGTGFGTSSCGTCVTYNGTAQGPTFWSNTKLISELPTTLSAGPVNVVVTVGGNSSNTVVFTLQITGTISGTVTNLANGTAINGANVGLYLGGVLQSSTTTGSNGAYSFSNLSPGTYSLTFSATGFSTASISTIPVQAGGTATENIALSTPSITTLSPSSGPVGTAVTISGNSFGALQGASGVTFAGTAAAPTSWSNGSIAVQVPSGAGSGAVVVSVGGASSNGVTFTVGTSTISGAVTASGTGIVGATVSALQLGVVKATATTGSGGSYSIGSLVPGTYDMEAADSNYGTDVVPGIVVTAGNVTTQNFALASAGSISGTVYEANGTTAISGATVTAFDLYTPAGSATTSSTGTYDISTLGPGNYSVTASAPGYDSTTKSGQKVTSGGTTTDNFDLTAGATINYAYDEAGRIKSVVDSLNSDALYSYDAAGNITAIAKKSSSTVAISEFIPNTGPVGTTVTIYGAAFSSTPSQNTVTFHNNIAATVTSATPTQLVTTVPTGATTGTIKVVAPAGSATSTASFTVTSSNGLPTITSFSPTIAAPGTPVTIDGTNFNTTPSDDSLTVNVNKTYATAATSTTLTTSIPGIVTSGHVTVTTTVGSFTTTSYLFVPPPGYLASQVEYTGQVTLGGQVTATLNTANQIGLVVVDVPVGDGLAIVTNSAFTSSVPYTIYDPYGNVMGSGNISTGNSYIESTKHIAVAGTCTIMIAPGSSTGYVTLSPTAIAPDIYVPITVGGSPVTIATTTPGQSGHLTFTGYPGERIYLYAYNPIGTKDQYGNQGSNIWMYDPSANQVLYWGGGAPGSTWWNYSGLITLSSSGTYTITFTPSGLSTWGATFQVGSVPADVTGTITVSPASGPPAPVTIATQSIGQSAHLTFTGTANQRLYLYAYNPTGTKDQYGDQGSNIWMYDPSGNQVLYWGGGAPGSTWYNYSGLITLSSSGTYTITFTASELSTWGATFSLVTIPTDITGTITVSPAGGPPAPVTIATQYPGQSAHLTFTGSANQRLYLYAYNPTGTKDQYGNQGSNIWMYNPSGGQVLYWGGGAPGSTWWNYSGLITLSAAGTYTITFTPSWLSTWGATFSLVTIPADVTNTITVSPAGGPPVPVTIATQYPGQSAHLTFTGSANQRLYLYGYNPTGTADQYGDQGSNIWMYNPSGGQVLYWGGGAPGSTWWNYSGLITLSAAGTYTITFTPSELSLWGATFSLVTIPTDVTNTITVSPAGGPPAPVTIATQYPGQSAHLTFTGSANQRLYLYGYNPTGTADQYGDQGSNIWMYNPSGGQVLYWGGGAPGSTWWNYSGLITLSASGTYTITFTPSWLSLWGATFSLVTIPADVTSSITLNTPVTIATSYPGQSGHLTFSNTVQNQQVYLYAYNPTGTKDQYGDQGSNIWMYDPSGNQILYWGGGAPGSTWSNCSSVLSLGTIGTYTVTFTPSWLSTWGATFEIMNTPCP
jgi:hypothetical protein